MNSTEGIIELRRRVMIGAEHRWLKCDQCQSARLIEELKIIEERGCARYFLVASDLVNSIREGGGLVGPGRGACGGSAVCYVLGITDVDPLPYGLLFERFLNENLNAPRAILIDVDAKGEMIALGYLDTHFSWSRQLRKSAVAPQYVNVNGIGEFGVTRIPELDLIAMTKDWISVSGREMPVLEAVEVDRMRFSNKPEELRFQEDLMALARDAGMTPAESDRYRKVLTRRMREEALVRRAQFPDALWQRMWARAGDLWIKAHCVCCAKLEQQVLIVKGLRE